MNPSIDLEVNPDSCYWRVHAVDHKGNRLNVSVDPDFPFMKWRLERAKRKLTKQIKLLWTEEERDDFKQILRDKRYESKHGPLEKETSVQCDSDMSQVPEGTSHTERSVRPRGSRKGN